MVLSGLAVLLAGRTLSVKSRLPDMHHWILATTFALTLTILFDLDHPRLGLIQMEAGDEAMLAVQKVVALD